MERQSIGSLTKGSQTEARIGTLLIGPAHNQVASVGLDRHAGRDVASLKQLFQLGHDRRQPGHIGSSSLRRHSDQCAEYGLGKAIGDGGLPAGWSSRVEGWPDRGCPMTRPRKVLALTAPQQHRLLAWARAATTPQRLARRARIILGSAAGLGSRRLAQQERMSRTTVQRWRARFIAAGCDGLQDLPRRGRPTRLLPTTRALVIALACERPAKRDVPLSRYSLSEMAAEVSNALGRDSPSRSTVWRWLMQDALRPWRHQCWIFPRDPNFLELAGPVLDLYACRWQGQPLWKDEYVLSADEKTSIQARRRLHTTLPPGPHQPARVEHEYERQGAIQYLAAWDVHRAVIFGRCEPKTGKAPFGRLVDQVMEQEPYCSARRVFWIVDNGSSHRGQRATDELKARHPRIVVVHTPVHASWLNQIELYFSILQRKVLTPNELYSLAELMERIHAFGERYSTLRKPFAWTFTRQKLQQRLSDSRIDLDPLLPLQQAA
jgi:transposase